MAFFINYCCIYIHIPIYSPKYIAAASSVCTMDVYVCFNYCALPWGRLLLLLLAFLSCRYFSVLGWGLLPSPPILIRMFIVLMQLIFGHLVMLVRFYRCSFWYYWETQSHNKLPILLVFTLFPYTLPQRSLNLRCGSCFKASFIGIPQLCILIGCGFLLHSPTVAKSNFLHDG